MAYKMPDEIHTDEIPLMTRRLIHIHTDLQITSGSQACIPRNACEHMIVDVYTWKV